MRVLFSWIGFRDLTYIDEQLKEDEFSQALKNAKESRTGLKEGVFSPIFVAYEHLVNNQQALDRLVIFSDINDEALRNGVKKFLQRYVAQVDVVEVEVPSAKVRNYGYILTSAAKQWQQIKESIGDRKDIAPYFSLSSGTTAMKAFWTVLGQAYYGDKAQFINVSEDGAKTEVYEIDFNLASFAVNETFQKIEHSAFKPIAGRSPEIQKAIRYAEKAARTNLNVLIYGETGTGKELFAKAIHDAGDRKDKDFVAINCATLSADLLVSSLFGSQKGAYTGAVDKKGLLEVLNGGTLFIDELEACPPEVQDKLLRVLQPPYDKPVTCRCFTPLGSNKEIESDVRIIAATNEQLEGNNFRADLLNRIAQLRINLPSLRERDGDVCFLAKCLFQNIKKQLGGDFIRKQLCDSAINFIVNRAWLGNVRELQNALTQAIVFSEDDEITANNFDQNLPSKATGSNKNRESLDVAEGVDLKSIIERETIRIQKKYVGEALKITKGNKTKAAELLGIKYQTIDNWKKSWEENDSK